MDTPKLNVEYEIIDAENPENNQVISADKPEEAMLSREDRLAKIAHEARILLASKIMARRDRENVRALKGRVKARRKKEQAAKVSRKRNRR